MKKVYVGLLLTFILMLVFTGVALAADPGISITVYVRTIPEAPTDFEITQTAVQNITLTWTKGTGANLTVIRGSTTAYPFNVNDGDLVYNGTGTNVVVSGVNLETTIYYYRAWSWNSYGYSAEYAQAQIGGSMTTAAAILLGFMLLFPFAFTGFYVWKREMWMGIVGSMAWFSVGAYIMSEVSTSTSVTQITDVWMALGWVCMALAMVFAVSTFAWRRHEIKWEPDEDEETGEPIMVMLKDGMRTGRTRDLSDEEVMNREKRIKEEQQERAMAKTQRRAASESSSFSQTGKV